MSVYEIIEKGVASGTASTVLIVVLVIASLLIKIPKLEVNIWGWLV